MLQVARCRVHCHACTCLRCLKKFGIWTEIGLEVCESGLMSKIKGAGSALLVWNHFRLQETPCYALVSTLFPCCHGKVSMMYKQPKILRETNPMHMSVSA